MADMNKAEYECKICLTCGLFGAAIGVGVLTWVLAQTGLSVWLLGIIALVAASVLFRVVDTYCHNRATAAPSAMPSAKPAAADTEAAPEVEAEDAAKRAAEQAAAEQAAAEQKAAEEKADAEAAAAKTAAAEAAAAEAAAAEQAAAPEVRETDGDEAEPEGEGTRPETLDGPRDGTGDDLKKIKGIGPKLASVCNDLGFYHFDQIAAWTADEIAWVDANLEGFKGRVTRDDWVAQAKILAAGGETEFSKRN